MKNQLVELIGKISSGCLPDAEIERIADEAAQAYADPQAFLAANPDINYDDSFPIPLGEWVVVGSLPETVLFQADSYSDLFQQITDSFGKEGLGRNHRFAGMAAAQNDWLMMLERQWHRWRVRCRSYITRCSCRNLRQRNTP